MRFQLFGADHLGALTVSALVVLGLTLALRRSPKAERPVRFVLAGLLVMGMLAFVTVEVAHGKAPLVDYLPLHLCDMALFIAVWALLTRSVAVVEVLYAWAGSGTVLAMITPELTRPFPDWYFLTYFGLHGGVVAAAVALVYGCGVTPRPGAPLRALLWLNVYAGVVALTNLVLGTNYLYLCRKPVTPTPLDWFGPWPTYILVAEAVALGLFSLLHLPFRGRSPPVVDT